MSRQSFVLHPSPIENPQPPVTATPPNHHQDVVPEVENKSSTGANPDIISLAQTAEQISRLRPDETIKVGTSLSFVVYLYEQLRSVIDNKSEHLLRRNAIERIFRRLLWENPKASFEEFGSQLIKELVWSRYLPNNSFTHQQADQVTAIIKKYSLLVNPNALFQNKNTNQQFVLSVLSAEIEEALDPHLLISEKLALAMQHYFESHFDWQDKGADEDKSLVLFVVVRKVLIKSDNARIAYQLLKKHFTNWSSQTKDEAKNNSQQINQIFNSVRSVQASPLFNPLYRFLSKQTAQFLILKDVVDSHPDQAVKIVTDQALLETNTSELSTKRYAQISGTITTGIIRSIIYILATKILFILLLEIPYELFSAGHINVITLVINLLTPPLLMLAVGLGIPRPGPKNTQLLVQRVENLVFPEDFSPRTLRLIEPQPKESLVFNIIYSAFAVFVFAIIVTALAFVHFTFLGILVFFLFLSLVLLFGFRVGFAATEFYVEPPHKGALSRYFEQLTLPLLNLGVLLSKGLERLNFLTILMDVLFEMPLKTVIDIINRWDQFMGKKRAEIVEVPIQ